MIKTKSIHDQPERSDGQRILVSLYWPKAADPKIVDLWLPELGSELELIKNWGTRKFDWNYFKLEYLKKIQQPELKSLIKDLAETAKEKNITLIGHARRSQDCQRTLLKEYIDNNYIFKTESLENKQTTL